MDLITFRRKTLLQLAHHHLCKEKLKIRLKLSLNVRNYSYWNSTVPSIVASATSSSSCYLAASVRGLTVKRADRGEIRANSLLQLCHEVLLWRLLLVRAIWVKTVASPFEAGSWRAKACGGRRKNYRLIEISGWPPVRKGNLYSLVSRAIP